MRPGLSPVAVVHLPQDCPLLLLDPSNLHSCFTLNCLSCLPLVSAPPPPIAYVSSFYQCVGKYFPIHVESIRSVPTKKLERLKSSKNLSRGPGSSALTGGDQTALYEKVIEEDKPCADLDLYKVNFRCVCVCVLISVNDAEVVTGCFLPLRSRPLNRFLAFFLFLCVLHFLSSLASSYSPSPP